MTEYKWLKFAGFLNECTYGLNHENCPFKKFRGLDKYQRIEHLVKVKETEAENMMNICTRNQVECAPIVFMNQVSEWSLAMSI